MKIQIIHFVFFGILLFTILFNYFKTKKKYYLLFIAPIAVGVMLETPLANHINNTIDLIIGLPTFACVVLGMYLRKKDLKSNNKK